MNRITFLSHSKLPTGANPTTHFPVKSLSLDSGLYPQLFLPFLFSISLTIIRPYFPLFSP